MSERVFEVSALSVRARVQRELRLAEHGTVLPGAVIIQPAPKLYELAARIGTHREAVTREFKRLESEDIIESRRGQVRVLDIERLKELEKD